MYRSILVSLLLIGTVTAVLAQTGATFVDNGNTSSANAFTTGRVDLQVKWAYQACPLNTIDGFISYLSPKMTPGDSVTEQLQVLNPSAAQVQGGCTSAYSTLDLHYSLRAFSGSGISGSTTGVQLTITSSTGTNPTTITTSGPHGLTPFDTVLISGHTLAGLNSTWEVSDTPSATTFTVDTLGGGTGGTMTPGNITTTLSHGLVTGDLVTIANHDASPALNGTYSITKVSDNAIYVPVAITSPGSNVGRVLRYREDLLASQLVLTIKHNKHRACPSGTNTLTVFNTLPHPTLVSSSVASPTTITITPETFGISSSSAANPTTITTSAPHSMAVGQTITITGHSAGAVNGTWTVLTSSPALSQFTIGVLGGGTGGTFSPQDELKTGDTVTITGHIGSVPAISGTYTATRVSATTFTIPVNVTVAGSGGSVQINDDTPYSGPMANSITNNGLVLWGNSPLTNGGDRPIAIAGQDLLCFNISLPASSPNIYQNLAATVVFRFDAQQSANN